MVHLRPPPDVPQRLAEPMTKTNAFSTFWRNHFVALIAIPILVGVGLQLFSRSYSEWDDVFVRAARELIDGLDIYRDGRAYLYPPFMAFAAIPFAILPHSLDRLLWSLINIAAIVLTIRSAWKIAGGGRLGSPTAANRREWLGVFLALLACMSFISQAISHQQVDVLIAALVLYGCLLLFEDRQKSGALLIGLGAAVKGPPLLFFAYFLARRRADLAFIVAATAIGVNLLPNLVFASPEQSTWLQLWVHRFVIPTQSWNAELGTWGTALGYNHSLGGTLHRLAAQVGGPTIKMVTYLTLIGMCALSMAVAAFNQLRARAARTDGAPSQSAAEMGQIVALMLLMSPNSSSAHFGILVLPAFVVARTALAGRRASLWAMLAGAALCGFVAGKDLVGEALYDVFLEYGNATWDAVMLWLGCTFAVLYGDLAPCRRGLRSWLIFPNGAAAPLDLSPNPDLMRGGGASGKEI